MGMTGSKSEVTFFSFPNARLSIIWKISKPVLIPSKTFQKLYYRSWYKIDTVSVWSNHHLVSSVGTAPVCCAGGQGFKPQTGPTLRVLKNWGECVSFLIISPNNSSLLGKGLWTVGPVSCIYSVTWLAGDVKAHTFLKRLSVWENARMRTMDYATNHSMILQIITILVIGYKAYFIERNMHVVLRALATLMLLV